MSILVFTATVHALSQYGLSMGIGAAKTSKEKEVPQLKPHDERGRKYGELNQRQAARIKKEQGPGNKVGPNTRAEEVIQ